MKNILAIILAVLIAGPAIAADYTRATTTQSINTYTPTTGGTVTLTRSNDTVAVISPAADIAALTIAMPTSPKDGDRVTITANKAITAVTFSGGTVVNGPASMSAGSSFTIAYIAAVTSWNQSSGIGGSGGLDKIVGVSGAVQGAVVRLQSGAYGMAASVCGMFSDATTCAKALGYADPRQFGATCSTSSYNDEIGIQAALNTGVPVMIPYPSCSITNKINFTASGQTIFSFGSGGRYNSNYPGNPYIKFQNALWDNRATSLNCGFDTKGYDNVTFKNIVMRGQYNLVGSVGICNTVGHQGGLSAAFVNLQDVSFLNLGNGVGAAMVSYFDDNPANPGTPYGADTPCTPISTGNQGVLYTTFFQVRAKGVDMIGNCMGMYGNLSDLHLSDFYGANENHQVIGSIPGYGSGWDITLGRVEYSGFGAGPTGAKTNFNDGAGMFFDSTFGVNVSNITCDHQYGSCITTGPGARNVNVNNIVAIDSGFGNLSTITDKSHFVMLGSKGVSWSNIVTRRNAVETPYVFTFRGANDFVRIVGTGGTAGATGNDPGGWATSYFNFVTTPTHFTYDVLGVGYSQSSPTTLSSLMGYTETPYDSGNSSTALTLDLANGTFQKITATGNATITMPTVVSGKSFTLRYYTGTGSFTAAFTGVKWPGGVTPTLTSTASRMDVFTFVSDGTNWYGSVSQNYTP